MCVAYARAHTHTHMHACMHVRVCIYMYAGVCVCVLDKCVCGCSDQPMMYKHAATLGIKTKLRGNGTLSGTEAAVEYTASNTSVFAQYNVDNKRSSVSLHSSITSALDVAMEVYFSPLNAYWRRSLDFTLALGALYKVDDASSIKGKVARSMVKLCYTRKARENLAMQVTAAIDTGKLSNVTSSHHKWGTSLSRLPLCPGCCLACPTHGDNPNTMRGLRRRQCHLG